ncbi:hypothetical protein NE237_001227 [Protea cynaroides]|uniref:F-box domain-containing protein n=1 Tax=Protea cynaroides TaxID=273540 RepID=A0A9Q0KSX2_9MAGN|nr:hypothetical protein NE237_001227 [Protea cynaroides]
MEKTKSSDPSSHAMEKPDGESSYRTNSGSIVSSNEDLMVNILSWLPVKVLSRFKCVSKQWNTLISDPYFIRVHQGRAPQDHNIMKLLWMTRGSYGDGLISVCSVEEKEKKKVTLDVIGSYYPDGFKYHSMNMIGRPCNGLICLEHLCFNEWTYHYKCLILVCNPETQNTVLIPQGTDRQYSFLQGLGFCSSSNEFKLVQLYERSENKWEGIGCELFTVGHRGVTGTHPLQPSRSWRHVGYFPCHEFCYLSDMCHVKGRVHWIIQPLLVSSFEFIVSLDLELEEFKLVSCPENWPEDVRRLQKCMDLIELGGELCVVFRNCDAWDIWVLKDYNNSIWSKEYQIKENIPKDPLFDDLKVVGIWRRRLLIIIDNEILCYYDPRNNSLDVIMEENFGNLSGRVAVFVENLVIPF